MQQFIRILILFITLFNNFKNIIFNPNILETGVFNILFLIIFLIITSKDLLSSLLTERKIKIIKEIQNAENYLNEAQKRLKESQKQLNQINIVIKKMENEKLITKKQIIISKTNKIKKELKYEFQQILNIFYSKQYKVFLEIKQQILLLTFKKVINKTKNKFEIKENSNKLINDIINKLEKDLL